MKKSIKKENEACYNIKLTFSAKEYEDAEKTIVKKLWKDVKVAGFREWHVPEHLVRQQLQPEYVTMWTYEQLINTWLQEVVKENDKIRFIWQPYGFDKFNEEQEKKDNNDKEKIKEISFKLDVYPEVKVKNDDRKKVKISKVETKIEEKEIKDALINLQKNYAEYKDTDIIKKDTVSKVAMHFLDKDGEMKDNWHIYVGEPEFKEFDFFKENFIDRKSNETFEIKYDDKKVPPTIKYTKEDTKDIKTIRFIIKDIKQIVLPKMDEETIKKLFGNDSKIKNEKELKEYIKENIGAQKIDTELVKNIETYIKETRTKSFDISIPNTLIDEEHKTRLQNLEKRFGSKEKVEEYFSQMGEQQTKAFLNDIKNAATDSLEKFFILQKIIELLELKIDRDKSSHLEAEYKVYKKLTWEDLQKDKKKDK